MQLLLDTHTYVRWLVDARKLSREQSRVLEAGTRRGEPAGICASSLIEIALLAIGGRISRGQLDFLLMEAESNPAFQVVPLTTGIAREVAAMGGTLRDPADQTIVATARIHRLRLVTSDQRIIGSGLVPVVE